MSRVRRENFNEAMLAVLPVLREWYKAGHSIQKVMSLIVEKAGSDWKPCKSVTIIAALAITHFSYKKFPRWCWERRRMQDAHVEEYE